MIALMPTKGRGAQQLSVIAPLKVKMRFAANCKGSAQLINISETRSSFFVEVGKKGTLTKEHLGFLE